MASVGRRWWKEGDGARPIRSTRGQRVENPRGTERWRGVLRRVPQCAAQRPPCVPLALAGYGCELRSCTSTARRPYGIPTRTVWYCIGRWSQVRREEAGRGPACGAAHRRTPVEGSRHVRVRRLASPAARHGPGAMYAQRATLQPKCLAAGAPHGTQAITCIVAEGRPCRRRAPPCPSHRLPWPLPRPGLCARTPAPTLAPMFPPLRRRGPRTSTVSTVLVSHRSVRRCAVAAAAAAAVAPSVIATRLAAVTAAVTTPRRLVVTRAAAPSAAMRLATRRRPAAPSWCLTGIARPLLADRPRLPRQLGHERRRRRRVPLRLSVSLRRLPFPPSFPAARRRAVAPSQPPVAS